MMSEIMSKKLLSTGGVFFAVCYIANLMAETKLDNLYGTILCGIIAIYGILFMAIQGSIDKLNKPVNIINEVKNETLPKITHE